MRRAVTQVVTELSAFAFAEQRTKRKRAHCMQICYHGKQTHSLHETTVGCADTTRVVIYIVHSTDALLLKNNFINTVIQRLFNDVFKFPNVLG